MTCILHRARRSAWPAVRSRWLSSAARPAVHSRDDAGCDPLNNLPPHVAARVGSRLVHAPHHPLCLIKTVIEQRFVEDGPSLEGSPSFAFFDDLSPVVTAQQCFDDLLTPSDHISRSRNDTFYLDAEHVLRTHTSAHQCELIRAGHDAFLCTGDVYRKDTVDASHSPVFHQMEGVRLFDRSAVDRAVVEADLKQALEGMVRALFGELGESEVRWIDAYFPFTEPSFEMEIFYGGEWLEVLGCGVIEQAILDNCGKEDSVGWAFGLGLERLAMVRFGIPDIRLFWSTDPRFLTQVRSERTEKHAGRILSLWVACCLTTLFSFSFSFYSLLLHKTV